MHDVIERWYAYAANHDPAALDALLDDDVVFQSPAVHTPQQGRALAAKYLRAAMEVLGNPSFRYVGEWRAERSAVLEFELELDGVYVDGVDMIWWNEAEQITRFQVMLRPLKALQTVVPAMAAALGMVPQNSSGGVPARD